MLLTAKNIFLLFVLELSLPLNIFCQQTEFRVTTYDETKGLQSSVITAMLQDSRGYLWFGTVDGLCRFDSYNFKTFGRISNNNNSLPGNYVVKLAEDHDGKIWIGLQKDGVSSYDPATGLFKSYNLSNIDSTSPLTRSVSMLFIDKENNVWVGVTQKGFVKLDKTTGKFSHYNVLADTNTFYSKEFRVNYNSAYAMYEEGNGIYWIATHDGLYRFNERNGEMRPVREKPLQRNFIQKNILRDDLFNTIVPDKKGLWLSSWAGGLSYYEFSTNRWSNYKFNSRFKNVATTNIIVDLKPKNENELWVASLDKGLGIFNTTSRQFYFFRDDTAQKIIPGKSCGLVMQDRQNNVWMAYEDGLAKIQQYEKKFVYVPVGSKTKKHSPGFGVSSMLEDKDGKYLLTGTAFGDGLYVTNNLTGKTEAISFEIMPHEESAMMVSDMIEDSKGVDWILTRDYLYQYDAATNKLISLPQPPAYMNGTRSNYFMVIREDKKGRMWIATARNGIFCYDPVLKTYQHFYNDPENKRSLPSNVIPAIAVDGLGRTWVGGSRGCFGYFDNSGNFINLDQYGKPSGKNFDTRIYSLYTDKKGDIWAGTDAGLFYYHAHERIPQLAKIYNTDNGLRGNLTAFVQEDNEGYIWCVTGSALCKINNQTGSIATFGKLDGIENIGGIGGIRLFPDGRMSLYTYEGYYIFDPSKCEKHEKMIPATLTSFKIDDKEQFFERKITSGERFVIPASANVISFEYAVLDFDRPDKQLYAYKLEGFDKDWIMAGNRHFAGYGNIPGGNYVFKIKATNIPDNWNVPVVSIPIHVRQPFFKEWWFILLGIVLIAGALFIFYRAKLKKQQQILQLEAKAQTLEKEKALVKYENLKQQLNPHFLFNSLTSLGGLIQSNQKLAVNFLDQLSKIYRYILKSRDSETVPLNEEVKFSQSYVSLQQTRFKEGLQVNFNLSEDDLCSRIAPVTLQNLIENAIKHNIIDKETPLIIDVYGEDRYLVVQNNLQKKAFVETSNKQGLLELQSLYKYITERPIIINEDRNYFTIKVPLK
jgi:ligand-binding sensor domain-containing protein